MVKIQAEAKMKTADEIKIVQIEATRDQAKIQAEKELTLKELELKAELKRKPVPVL